MIVNIVRLYAILMHVYLLMHPDSKNEIIGCSERYFPSLKLASDSGKNCLKSFGSQLMLLGIGPFISSSVHGNRQYRPHPEMNSRGKIAANKAQSFKTSKLNQLYKLCTISSSREIALGFAFSSICEHTTPIG